jgi:hypothetical protein
VEFYRDDFAASARAFRRFLRRCALPAGGGPATPIGVVVLPWVGTAVPWYAITLAIGLLRREREVMLIWDDTSFPDLPGAIEAQNRIIAKSLAELPARLTWCRLSDEKAQPVQPEDPAWIDSLVKQNVTWILRGRPAVDSDRSLEAECAASLERSVGLIRGLLRRVPLAGMVVPGGIYSSSCAFLRAAAERHVPVTTYDSRIGAAALCHDGIAAQQQDIPAAFQQLWPAGPQERAAMVRSAQREHALRTEARDLAQFQATRADGTSHDAHVLLPLNVDFDSAALGRHYLFPDTITWVTETIAHILGRSAASVVVRQHPSERRAVERSRLDMGRILLDRFGGDSRLRFVAAEDPVSTYDLLRSASLVLPFVSSIAMEAAALAKPVVISGRCYYSDLGFVWSPGSRDEYFDLLARGLAGRLPLLEDQAERAWLCYYLTQVCNRLWTSFTPQPPDFWTWVRRRPEDVFADPPVSDIFTSLNERIPASLVRHARLQRGEGIRSSA